MARNNYLVRLLLQKSGFLVTESKVLHTPGWLLLSLNDVNGTILLQLGTHTRALESIRERSSIGKVGPLPSSCECIGIHGFHSHFGSQQCSGMDEAKNKLQSLAFSSGYSPGLPGEP